MAHDIARLILEYSRKNESPEEIRDCFKKNYYNLHKHPDWKVRFKTMIQTVYTKKILDNLTIEQSLIDYVAPALVWGKIKYDLDTEYFEFGINLTDETDLNKGVFHLNLNNTEILLDRDQLSESEKKYTTRYRLHWIYFKPGTKIREFLDYVLRFGLVPQVHHFNDHDEDVSPSSTWWLRFDFLLNAQTGI